jgi:hypothetical protein
MAIKHLVRQRPTRLIKRILLIPFHCGDFRVPFAARLPAITDSRLFEFF